MDNFDRISILIEVYSNTVLENVRELNKFQNNRILFELTSSIKESMEERIKITEYFCPKHTNLNKAKEIYCKKYISVKDFNTFKNLNLLTIESNEVENELYRNEANQNKEIVEIVKRYKNIQKQYGNKKEDK